MDPGGKLGGSLSQKKVRNYNFCGEPIEINVLVGVLSDLLTPQAGQLPNFDFGILLDEYRVGTVSIGRQLFRMTCAQIHMFSDRVLFLGDGDIFDALRVFNDGWITS